MPKPRKVPTVKKVTKGSALDEQDVCIKRIEECQIVIDHLETCPAWEVIKKDCQEGKQEIDDSWWKLPEGSPQLQEFRITALAYMHLFGLVDKYKLDLENAKKQLDTYQNTDKKVIKDFDPN